MSTITLAELLKEAAEQHHLYEVAAPPHHWADWYAAYIHARQAGDSPAHAVGVAKGAVEWVHSWATAVAPLRPLGGA